MAIPSAILTHSRQFHQPPGNNICQIALQWWQQHQPQGYNICQKQTNKTVATTSATWQ